MVEMVKMILTDEMSEPVELVWLSKWLNGVNG